MAGCSTLPPFPDDWPGKLAGLPHRLTVNVAGYPITVEVTRGQLRQAYLPVLSLLQQSLGTDRRIVAGLAGIPGSGKSTFAAVLNRLADVLWGMGRLVTVGMDGWHWPNDVLDTRTTTDEAGNAVPLRRRKGGPESFDVDAIISALKRLRSSAGAVSLPVYDRRLHDPVPDKLTVGPGTTILLIEGNFLLERRPPWNRVFDLLGPRLYLECDPAAARDRVIARHVRGGMSPDDAARKFDENDRLNIDVVLATADNADHRIRLDG